MSELALGFLALGLLAIGLYGLVLALFFKGRRKRGGLIFLATIVGMVAIGSLDERERARSAGFESAADYRAARNAGIEDPEAWELERARIEAYRIEQERLAEEEAQRLAEAEEERRRQEEAEAQAMAAREEAERQEREAEERRSGFHCLSAWDGSHRAFMRDIQNRMREPDSFEHIETRVTPVDENGQHLVLMRYRARNGFGGMNVSEALGSFQNDTCSHTVLSVE